MSVCVRIMILFFIFQALGNMAHKAQWDQKLPVYGWER